MYNKGFNLDTVLLTLPLTLPLYPLSLPLLSTYFNFATTYPSPNLATPCIYLTYTFPIPWTFLGRSLDVPWTFLGRSLDVPWTFLGRSLDVRTISGEIVRYKSSAIMKAILNYELSIVNFEL